LSPSPYGRFAVAVTSTERGSDDGTEVRTDRTSVRLDRDAVAHYASSGKVAARLYAEVCEAQAESRMRGYAAGIPFFLASTLSSTDRARLETMAAEQRDD
jgi:hypothetical protein